jgi:hypothetical protein
MTVFVVGAPRSLIGTNRYFRRACCLHHQYDDHPDDGGTKLQLISTRLHGTITQKTSH